jgi:hypothetical protein
MIKYFIILLIAFTGTAQATQAQQDELRDMTICHIIAREDYLNIFMKYAMAPPDTDMSAYDATYEALDARQKWFKYKSIVMTARIWPTKNGNVVFPNHVLPFYEEGIKDERNLLSNIAGHMRDTGCDIIYDSK